MNRIPQFVNSTNNQSIVARSLMTVHYHLNTLLRSTFRELSGRFSSKNTQKYSAVKTLFHTHCTHCRESLCYSTSDIMNFWEGQLVLVDSL